MPILKEIRILPPIAIARLGNAEHPMESFCFADNSDDNGFRDLKFEPSFIVNPDGTVSEQEVPNRPLIPGDFTVSHNSIKKVKPVAPFFELWGIFDDDEDALKPLTQNNLGNINLEDIVWTIDIANRKMSRRTKDDNDIIERKINDVKAPLKITSSEYTKHSILARSNNFKATPEGEKIEISLGQVQIIKSSANDVIKLRFTPAQGKVFHQGSEAHPLSGDNQQIIKLKQQSLWPGYKIGAKANPLDPFPSNTVDDDGNGSNVLISSGMFDDTCDGIISVRINTAQGAQLTAQARITVGPPDYSPDTQFIRSVDDELEQLILGPIATEEQYPNTEAGNIKLYKDVINIIQSASDTVQVTKPADNVKKVYPKKDIEPLESQLDYQNVTFRHRQLLHSMTSFPLTCDWKTKAYPWLSWINNKLRTSTQKKLDTDQPGSWKMPKFMLDINQQELTLTNRQRNKVQLATKRFGHNASIAPLCKMQELIYQLAPTAKLGKHLNINITLGDKTINLERLFKDIEKDQLEGIPFTHSPSVETLIDALENGSSGAKLIDLTTTADASFIYLLFKNTMKNRLDGRSEAINAIVIDWVNYVIDKHKINSLQKAKTINKNDIMAQIRYRPMGNPMTSSIHSAVSNCSPGLEIDFRGVWQRFIREVSETHSLDNDWVLHETRSWLLNKAGEHQNKRAEVKLIDPKGNKDIEFNNKTIDRFNLLSSVLFNEKGEYTFDSDNTYIGQVDEQPEGMVILNEIIDRDTGVVNRLQSGELTHALCSPWQHDFRGCSCAYWSANRPDFVDFDSHTNQGEKWMFKTNRVQSGEGRATDQSENRYPYEDLYENWQDKLRFVIKGRT